MNILFYTIANKRSRDIESQALEFAKDGHSVFLLTLTPRSDLHVFFEQQGFSTKALSSEFSWFPIYFIQKLFQLAIYCRRNKINLVLSHLDPCNLVAVVSQHFLPAKIVVNRHHADALIYEASEKAQKISRWIYRHAKHIIVVSNNVKDYMVKSEQVRPERITVIPLSYNFDLYALPPKEEVTKIREQNKSDVLLCTVGRFVSLKRMNLIIELLEKLVKSGLDARLMIVGEGVEGDHLKAQVHALGISHRVNFTGFTHHVLPYIAAADWYIHFSLSEATCTVVKESGLVATPVIVCSHVGDFDEYIVHEENGFLVDRDAPVDAAYHIVKTLSGTETAVKTGVQLQKTILTHFDIRRTFSLFYDLLNRLE